MAGVMAQPNTDSDFQEIMVRENRRAIADARASGASPVHGRMYDDWSTALPIDDGDERPLLIALVAIVAAWSLALLLAL